MRVARLASLMIASLFAVASLVALAPSASAVPPYPGRCIITTSVTTAHTGQEVVIKATGFPAGATVTFTMTPSGGGTTVTLGSAVANPAGIVHFNFKLAPGTPPGMYIITATGPATSFCDPLISTNLMVSAATVATPPATTTTGNSGVLPRTGTNSALLFEIALLLIALGGLITLTTRKRLRRATVEIDR
jgi:hypothetical protein